jgi:DNA polymerase-4
MKIMCVLLPHFPLRCESLRYPEINLNSAAVTMASGSQKQILDYSPDLSRLERGMPVAQALSLYENLALIHADAPYYQAVFDAILDALETSSPLVEGADLGEVYIGADGLQSIYKTDDILVRAVRETIPAGFEARIGIARGKFPACLAAWHSPQGGYRILGEDLAAFLKDLSCDLLPVSLKTRARLHEYGLHTLGQIAAMPVGPLQAQFGPEGLRICELALGQDETALIPRVTEEVIAESTMLPTVTVSLDIMLMAIEAMLARAFVRLEARGRGISRINLWTLSLLREHREKDINFKEPAMNVKTALTRIRHVMESCPQPGPVEQLGIKVTGLGRQKGKQKSLFTEVRAQEHLLEDVRQLEFRLGGPQVYSVKEVEPWSRIPERRYALIPLSR